MAPSAGKKRNAVEDLVLLNSSDLAKANLALFDNYKYSDLTVRCKKEVWCCHRVTLCTRCPRLEEDSASCMEELTINEGEPSAVEKMLRYLYTLELPAFEPHHCTVTDVGRDKVWKDAFDVFNIAERYNLAALSTAAHEVLLKHAPELCSQWDRFDNEKKSNRLDMVIGVWWQYPDDHELYRLKAAILGGLVLIADKLAEYAQLNDKLMGSSAFMCDYIKAASTEIGRKRKRREVIDLSTPDEDGEYEMNLMNQRLDDEMRDHLGRRRNYI